MKVQILSFFIPQNMISLFVKKIEKINVHVLLFYFISPENRSLRRLISILTDRL